MDPGDELKALEALLGEELPRSLRCTGCGHLCPGNELCPKCGCDPMGPADTLCAACDGRARDAERVG